MLFALLKGFKLNDAHTSVRLQIAEGFVFGFARVQTVKLGLAVTREWFVHTQMQVLVSSDMNLMTT